MEILKYIFKSKKYKFLFIHILSVIIFAILYYLDDYITTKYPKLINKLHLGKPQNNKYVSSFVYYLWYSLITQTTVGYAGLLDASGVNIPFIKIESKLYIIFNFLQLLSIILIPIFTL